LAIYVIVSVPPLDASHFEAQLEAVQDAIRFTDSQSSPISFSTSVRQSEIYGDHSYTIQVIPDESFKDGWHTLSLASIPEGFAIPWVYEISEDGSLLLCPDNTPPSTRFRTDSWPTLWGVSTSPSEEKVRLYLYFSEPVKVTNVQKNLIEVTSSTSNVVCWPIIQQSESYDILGMDCPHMSLQDRITVEIPPGLVSLEDVELKGPLVHQFIVGEGKELGNGVRLYQAPIVE